jgi:hypothetical protein
MAADEHGTTGDRGENPQSAYEGRIGAESVSPGTERSSVANGPTHGDTRESDKHGLEGERKREGGGAASEREE